MPQESFRNDAKRGCSSPSTAVVHLALRDYGIEAFRDFIGSYRAHPAGRPHDLLIAAKQFADESEFAPFGEALNGVAHRLIMVPDEGFDLGSYFLIARQTDYAGYCFLNSLSAVLADDWLAKLAAPAEASPGSIVGASGSYRSVSSEVARMDFPSVPRSLLPLRRLLGFLQVLRQYPPYPNPHLRTNAFFVERETLLALDQPEIRTKADSSLFESGWGNVTRQIRARGGEVLVVDRTGRAHQIDDWKRSNTFWHGEQEGLLVADKQTRLYEDANESYREELREGAWRTD